MIKTLSEQCEQFIKKRFFLFFGYKTTYLGMIFFKLNKYCTPLLVYA